MNPFQAIMGTNTIPAGGMGQSAQMMQNGPFGAIMGRAQQLMGMFRNPQQLVQQFFPGAPEEVRSDPNALMNWLQQNGVYSQQQIDMARRMAGGR